MLFFYIYLLFGTLGAETAQQRSFVPLNGFTEIMPGRITVPMIVSPDGNTYFDVAKGKIGGNFEFLNAQGKTTTLIQGGKLVNEVINTNTLEARIVNTRAKNAQGQHIGTGIKISPQLDTLEAYDQNGNIRIALQGGVTGNGVPNLRVQNRGTYLEYSMLTPTELTIFENQNYATFNAYGVIQVKMNQGGAGETQFSLSANGIKMPREAKMDMPGVLCAGSVNKTDGTMDSAWGGKSKPYSVKHNGLKGQYKITHNIGHDDYFITATIASVNGSFSGSVIIMEKKTSYIVLGVKGLDDKFYDCAFEFIIAGKN